MSKELETKLNELETKMKSFETIINETLPNILKGIDTKIASLQGQSSAQFTLEQMITNLTQSVLKLNVTVDAIATDYSAVKTDYINLKQDYFFIRMYVLNYCAIKEDKQAEFDEKIKPLLTPKEEAKPE